MPTSDTIDANSRMAGSDPLRRATSPAARADQLRPDASKAARITVSLVAATLAGCHAAAPAPSPTASPALVGRATQDAGLIPCAHGDAALTRACAIDQRPSRDGVILILRHPDGAFRRLLVTRDGRGVIAADGALRATVTVVDPDTIDVTLGGDRYRLPATVKAAR